MTPLQIRDRLREEFGSSYVSFDLEITNYNPACDDDPEFRVVTMSIYHTKHGRTECSSLEDGIKALKLKMNLIVPEMELTV